MHCALEAVSRFIVVDVGDNDELLKKKDWNEQSRDVGNGHRCVGVLLGVLNYFLPAL